MQTGNLSLANKNSMPLKTDPKLLRRTLSTLIDYGLYLLFFVWLVTTYGVPNDEGGYTLKNDPKGWWIFVVWRVYFPIIESIRGQTLGKAILGLRVVTKAGNPITFSQAARRHFVDIIDFFFFGIPAVIAIRNTPDHQRLGDLWAKTIVVGGDIFACSNCGESLALSSEEMMKKEFACPKCKAVVKI
jgi:uncharacterized RDD family membrane protein YckC